MHMIMIATLMLRSVDISLTMHITTLLITRIMIMYIIMVTSLVMRIIDYAYYLRF